MTEERPKTVTFSPLDVGYNPIRLQAMSFPLYLHHPDSPDKMTKYLVRPRRLCLDLRGGGVVGSLGAYYDSQSPTHLTCLSHRVKP